MENMVATVGVPMTESVPDDAVQAQETVETEQQNALEQFISDEIAEQDAETQEQPEETAEGKTETETPVSKGLKGRIAAAEQKADKAGYERGRAEVQREFEAYKASVSEKMQKYQEYELEQEAKKLAKSESCSVELAKRIIRAERGIQAPMNTPVQTAVAQNTGTAVPESNTAEERARALMSQAESIKSTHGVDTLEIFRTNEEVRKKVGSGEWDMRDVLVYSLTQTKKTEPVKPAPAPKPVHSGGNAGYNVGMNFETMTNEQFEKFKAKIRGGASFRPR